MRKALPDRSENTVEPSGRRCSQHSRSKRRNCPAAERQWGNQHKTHSHRLHVRRFRCSERCPCQDVPLLPLLTTTTPDNSPQRPNRPCRRGAGSAESERMMREDGNALILACILIGSDVATQEFSSLACVGLCALGNERDLHARFRALGATLSDQSRIRPVGVDEPTRWLHGTIGFWYERFRIPDFGRLQGPEGRWALW
jgi:hypothetical protein